MLDTGEAPVHYLADVSSVGSVKITVSQLSSSLDFLNRTNLGWTVISSANPVVTFIANVVSTITKTRLKTVKNMTEAMEILHRVDKSLREIF